MTSHLESPHLEIIEPGPFATLQDAGRPGLAHLGVSPSGAADRGALALTRRLLGHDPDEAPGRAVIEATLGGLTLRLHGERTVACVLAGADARAGVNGRPVGHRTRFYLAPGDVLRLASPTVGLRTLVGFDADLLAAPVLGSRSHDVLAQLGPAPLRAGDRVPLGPASGRFPPVASVPAAVPTGPLKVMRGPRDDWFSDPEQFVQTGWTVSPVSNRVGVRLVGPPLARARAGELPSEGVVRGAVQVTASGEPVIFLADHPVTGGYPVIGVLTPTSVDRAAQARPGEVLGFGWVLR